MAAVEGDEGGKKRRNQVRKSKGPTNNRVPDNRKLNTPVDVGAATVPTGTGEIRDRSGRTILGAPSERPGAAFFRLHSASRRPRVSRGKKQR